jgi:hypothetical protein
MLGYGRMVVASSQMRRMPRDNQHENAASIRMRMPLVV